MAPAKKHRRDLLPIGTIGDPIPKGFVHPYQVTDYMASDFDPDALKLSITGTEGCYGRTWTVLGLTFESYTSDQEPRLPPGKRRVVMWQRISHTDKPPGWHGLYLGIFNTQMGLAEIKNPNEYWKSWVGDARRNRTRFINGNAWDLKQVNMEAYLKAYEAVPGFASLKPRFIRRIKLKDAVLSKDIDYILAIEKKSGRVLAGLATLHLPSISQSIHHNAFLDHTAPLSPVSTGLIDHWFRLCIAKNIRFLNFGVFWSPGEDRSWKGFSRFKAQFITHMIRFPRMLVKITKGDA